MTTQENATQSPSATRKIVGTLLGSIIPVISVLGYIAFIGILLSPWFITQLDNFFESYIHTVGTVQSCALIRDGKLHENVIRCDVGFMFNGKPYVASGNAWYSDSPFDTPAGLERVLGEQSAIRTRPVAFNPHDPMRADIVDDRWLAVPGLWAIYGAVVLALFGLAIYLEPSRTIYKRADLTVDPATGQLVEGNSSRRDRIRRLSGLWCIALLLAMLGCVYGLSNRFENAVSMLGFSGLQEFPAQLTACEHHFHGSSKGHDQIECTVQYRWNGQPLLAQAEAQDYRFLPTDARMDSAVQAMQNQPVVAYVDPQYPAYVRAFPSNAWVVFTSWGIFELMLLVLLVFVFPTMLVSFVRRMHANRRVA